MNAHCAIHGHDWFWRHALRMRMCARCHRLDATPSAAPPASALPPERVTARRWAPQGALR